MTDKGPSSGSEWADGNVLNSADLIDSIASENWLKVVPFNDSSGADIQAIVAHSKTTYSIYTSSNAILQTSDTGRTWTSRNTDLDSNSLMVSGRTDKTIGFATEITTAAECAYTSDSGATWTTKTSSAFGTGINDVSMPASGLIVLAGNDAAGTDHIVYSTDQGGTWTDPTVAPSAEVYAVSMFDTSTGFAVDSSGNIWKTTDGGDNWTDTTHNLTNNPGAANKCKIYAISATSILAFSNSVIELYTGSANASAVQFFDGDYQYCGGMIEASNGDLVVLAYDGTSKTALARTVDDGITWYRRAFPEGSDANGTYLKTMIEEDGDNSVVFCSKRREIELIPVGDTT